MVDPAVSSLIPSTQWSILVLWKHDHLERELLLDEFVFDRVLPLPQENQVRQWMDSEAFSKTLKVIAYHDGVQCHSLIAALASSLDDIVATLISYEPLSDLAPVPLKTSHGDLDALVASRQCEVCDTSRSLVTSHTDARVT